jgi:hypothetical protein
MSSLHFLGDKKLIKALKMVTSFSSFLASKVSGNLGNFPK